MPEEKVIKTKQIGKNFVKSNFVPLEITPDTALVFEPEIHPGGVRGHLIRFKKNRNLEWEKIPEEDFKQLEPFDGTYTLLSTTALTRLLEATKQRMTIAESGVGIGTQEYVVAPKDDVLQVDDKNIKIIFQNLLKEKKPDEFWSILNDSNPDLINSLITGYLLKKREGVVKDLEFRLSGNFLETTGSDSWQNWIYNNSWLFGVFYQRPIEKQKINLTGIMPDYLFPRLDGFVDVLEIKLPSESVIVEDRSHPGSWIWSSVTNSAIGQVVNYLCEIDRLRFEIQSKIKEVYDRDVLLLKPKGYILIGQSASWTQAQKEALKKLNHSLHGIEVLTYTDLLERGKSFLIGVYE